MYGEALATARANVYDQAAELVIQMGQTSETAEFFMRHAVQASVRSASLIDFDRDGIRYSQARAWQLCAWQINPTLPEVQPKWN